MDDFTRKARRYTAGRTVLDALAALFLGCSALFWLVIHWTALVGTGLPTLARIPQAIVAVAITLIYAFALPLLLSMLVPTTPAGQLLQKTQWRTIGFPVIIVSTLLLGYYAHQLMRAWFDSQEFAREANLTPAYMAAAIVGFIIIPALCWVQVSPERWIREIEQAHAVKKLELMQRGELAIVKARLLWAEQKALVGYANLLPAEQQEVLDTMKGLMMGISDTQHAIARTLGIQAEVERSIMGDEEIADSLDYVARQLEQKNITPIHDRGRESHDRAVEQAAPPHVDTRLQPSIPRAAESGTVRQSQAQSDDELDVLSTIRDVLPRIFTAQDVADLMRYQDKRPAQRLISIWIEYGDVKEVRLGRYSLK